MSESEARDPGLPDGGSVAAAILDRLAEDALRGELRAAADYAVEFPGFEAQVAEIHRSLERDVQNDVEPDRLPLRSVGGYTLERELARGGQGVVYLARDPRLGRQVAVKILTAWSALQADAVTRLLREAELASKVEHPAVCTIYASGIEQGLPYIVMRYVRGVSLGQWVEGIRRDSRAGRDQIATAVERLARALHLAHLQGIVHRDVKPSNIRVTPEGQPVLLDFGLARRLEQEGPSLTGSQDMLGTPAYMAPEQLEPRKRSLSPRTDVYALCVTFYELLTGRRPFAGATLESTYRAILSGEHTDPMLLNPAIDRDLKTIIETGFERDPARRYASAELLADDLVRYLQRMPIAAKPIGALQRLARWYRRRPALATALTMVGLSLTGGLCVTLYLLGVVTSEHERANRKAEEYAHLAAGRSLDELLAEADARFWQPRPERIEAIEGWLERARAIVSALPIYRETRARMIAASRPADLRDDPFSSGLARMLAELEGQREALRAVLAEGEPPAADWREVEEERAHEIEALESLLASPENREFETAEEAWHFGQLARLIERLEAFERGGEGEISIPAVEGLLATARDIGPRTIEEAAPSWARARAELAQDARFAGVELRPIVGLVPLGADPGSGLQEFAVYGTGELPARAPDGKLELRERAAAVLVLLPGGTQQLGADPSDESSLSNEVQRVVHLAPFMIGKHELTQGQWLAVLGRNPSAYSPGRANLPNPVDLRNPVESVTWYEARDFALRLGLCLPTEAQWEHACRAGATTRFAWGDAFEVLAQRENVGDRSVTISGFESAPWDDGYVVHAPAGSFEANAFGLYDMHGNVAEWTRDRYRFTPLAPLDDAPGSGADLSATGPNRVFRGGSWYTSPRFARSSARHQADPTRASEVNGLRLALDLSP